MAYNLKASRLNSQVSLLLQFFLLFKGFFCIFPVEVDAIHCKPSRICLRGGDSVERTSDFDVGGVDPIFKQAGNGLPKPASAIRKSPAKEPKPKLCILRPNAKIIQTSTLEAASTGDVEELQRLFSLDPACVDSKDYDRRSALHVACADGHAAAVDFLLSHGAKTDAEDRWGHVPLQDALLHGHREVVALLSAAGVTLSEEARLEVETRLCRFAARGDVARMRPLLDAGVSVDAADYDGRTALHLAAAGGHLAAAQELLGRGSK
eukprot:CAMPEP_0172195492 /NCGR_PEP_ID=MMETSP1050-20130122/26239_1 /TAXON_ID=233186 /ORGANISM="Cryptomonas curvata, Strain CCAP979/52" /LENGTH=263 /DNA_ID=CAMNT_0012871563 /DNA_START=120 /DNA_END=908 /DNA_ORIENTATION=+